MVKIVTHNGVFHADDVFAIAALQIYLGKEEVEVIRSRDEAVIANGDWVVDVGGVYDPMTKRFDHHQQGAPVRENGLPYAAFGLIWKEVGESISRSPEVARRIEERLVLPIDANDVGVSIHTALDLEMLPFEIHDAISIFNPAKNSEEDADKNFEQAVSVAKLILERLIVRTHARIEMEAVAADVYAKTTNKRVLVSDVPLSSDLFMDYADVEIVVTPDDPKTSSNWAAVIVAKSVGFGHAKQKFPAAWAGLRTNELAEVSGIEDAVFCHKSLHFFVAKSKESALKAAGQVVKG